MSVELGLRNEGENTYILTGSRKRSSRGRAKPQSICLAVLTEHLLPVLRCLPPAPRGHAECHRAPRKGEAQPLSTRNLPGVCETVIGIEGGPGLGGPARVGHRGRSQKLTRQRTGNAKEQRFLLGLTGTLSLTTHDSLFLPFPFPLQPLDSDFGNIKEVECLAFVSDLAPDSGGCGGRGENAGHCLPAPGPGTLPGRHRPLAAAGGIARRRERTKPPRGSRAAPSARHPSVSSSTLTSLHPLRLGFHHERTIYYGTRQGMPDDDGGPRAATFLFGSQVLPSMLGIPRRGRPLQAPLG